MPTPIDILKDPEQPRDPRLGRLCPPDFKHVKKYPLRAVMPTDIKKVERVLKLPYYHWKHDQKNEGACVGFGVSMAMAILNEQEARIKNTSPKTHLYNSRWLYLEAQKVDEWEGEEYEGTSVRAAMDVLRKRGHVRVRGKVQFEASMADGIKENRWAQNVDEMRVSISKGIPVAIGVNWYDAFDDTQLIKKGKEYFITDDLENLGMIRGGHCVCVYGASDKRKAFKIKNSWGTKYPLVWMPYNVMERLLKEEGEATLITDI